MKLSWSVNPGSSWLIARHSVTSFGVSERQRWL
jgi:hypothetical protein